MADKTGHDASRARRGPDEPAHEGGPTRGAAAAAARGARHAARAGLSTRRSMLVCGPRLPPQNPSVTQSGTTSSLCGQMPPVVKQTRFWTSATIWNIAPDARPIQLLHRQCTRQQLLERSRAHQYCTSHSCSALSRVERVCSAASAIVGVRGRVRPTVGATGGNSQNN